jgi:membrane-associated protease RseP (regulator of RpoE activity)
VRAGPAGARTAIGLPPGTYAVRAGCEGFAPGPPLQIVITDRDVVGQIWRVEPGATVRGRVLTRRGDPIAGDGVQLSAGERSFSSPARTGPDGSFAIAGLPAATYEVSVTHGSGEVKLAPLVVAERATIDRDLVIDDTGGIRGVVASADGRPVSQIRVDAGIDGDARWHDLTWTDDDGRFLFDGAPPGRYRLSTTPEGREVDVTVRAGETVEARLETEARSGVIRGTVVGTDGVPIADAVVAVSTGYEQDEARVSTGPGGAFEVRSLRAQESYWLTAYRPGGGSATVRNVGVGDTVEIRIRPPGSIEGTVTGAPDPVVLQITGETSQKLTLFRTGGRYAFTGLPPGPYEITAEIEGKHARVDVTLAEGEHKRGVDLRVQGLTTITGRMIDARTRAPVAGLFVKLVEPGSDMVEDSEKTDAGGRFTFRDRRPGTKMIYGSIVELHGDTTLCSELRHVTGESFDAGELPVLSERPARRYQFGFEIADLEGRHDATAWRATISSVEPGGPAARAGLQPGDVITAVNGTDVTGPRVPLLDALADASPSGVARMTLARGVTLAIAGTSRSKAP